MKSTPIETNCPPVRDLDRLLHSALPAAEAARLEDHLRECAVCRQIWQELRMESSQGQTSPVLQPIEDTGHTPTVPAPSDSAITWSSEIQPAGGGGDRAPLPPRKPAPEPRRSYPFLAPPRDASELGWLRHYRVTAVLGEGGMGFVFDAFDTHLHRRVALKVLKPELAANASFRERFLQEARAAAALPDDYIITIYEVGQEAGVPFLAMKFLHGESLEDRILREGRLPPPEVMSIGREIALGLSAAHERGLIHRDIKPANIWLETPAAPPLSPPETGGDKGGSGPRLSCEYLYRVKILDFGLARPIHDARKLTATGLIVGTPQYLAPEQARGQALDHRCDLFSLGIVLYHLATGVLPFDGADTLALLTALAVSDPCPVEKLAPDVPVGLRLLIHQLLARNPAQRPATARSVAEQLRALEKGSSPSGAFSSAPTVPLSSPPPVPPGGRRRGRWLAAGLCGVLVIAAILGWFLHRPTGAVPLTNEPIKVGVLFSATGTMANAGGPCTDAALLAIDEWNEQGGLLGRHIEPVTADGESDSLLFAQRAEELIGQKQVCAIVGCRTSASRKAVLPVVEKHNNLLLYPMQFEGLEQSPNIIYLGAAPNQQMIPALSYMVKMQNKRRLFLVGSDYVFPRTANAIIRAEVHSKLKEAQIVGEAYIRLGSSEVGEAIQMIKDKKPDLILNTINGDDNAVFFRELSSAGLTAATGTHVLSFSIGENDLRSLRNEGNGHYAAWSYFQSVPRRENKAFVQKFRKRFGPQRVLSDPMETVYFGLQMWARAVQSAGSIEPDAVRAALKGMEFEAPEGMVRIDPQTQYTWRVMRLGQLMEGGQFKIVWNTETPGEPEPYPRSEEYPTSADWDQFLYGLARGWGGGWEPPRR